MPSKGGHFPKNIYFWKHLSPFKLKVHAKVGPVSSKLMTKQFKKKKKNVLTLKIVKNGYRHRQEKSIFGSIFDIQTLIYVFHGKKENVPLKP